MSEIIISSSNASVIKERAGKLAESINKAKERGIVVIPHEPIEGKMFWTED